MTEWSILGPIVLGIVIGILEMIVVHMDESGMGWFAHGLHALPFVFILLFVSMNIEWALSLVKLDNINIFIELGIRVVIGIIATVKIKLAAAVVGKAGEKTGHALLIGGLIAVAPYIWQFIFEPILSNFDLPIQ